MRGVNYRAPGHPFGILLIVLSPFTDSRARTQGLMRVGRFDDACYRIQNGLVDDTDRLGDATRKGNIEREVETLRSKPEFNGKPKVKATNMSDMVNNMGQ